MMKSKGDNIIQTEVLIEMLNIKLAKYVYHKDEVKIKELEALRHKINYAEFDFQDVLKEITKM